MKITKKILASILVLMVLAISLSKPVEAALNCDQFASVGMVNCSWSSVSGAVEYLFTETTKNYPTEGKTVTGTTLNISADFIKKVAPNLCSDKDGIITLIATPCFKTGASCDLSKGQTYSLDYRFACAPSTCDVEDLDCDYDSEDWSCDISCSGSDNNFCYYVSIGGNFYDFLEKTDDVSGLTKDLPCGSSKIKAYSADCDNRRYDSSNYSSDTVYRSCNNSPSCNSIECNYVYGTYSCSIACSDNDSDLNYIGYGITGKPEGATIFNNTDRYSLVLPSYTCGSTGIGYGDITLNAYGKDTQGNKSATFSKTLNCPDDRCNNISCPQYCKDGVSYSSGNCSAGECTYQTTTCNNGCDGNTCKACTPNDHKTCAGNDLITYDSCGNETSRETCADGCENRSAGRSAGSVQNNGSMCKACSAASSFVCSSDGNLHSLNSCGRDEGIFSECTYGCVENQCISQTEYACSDFSTTDWSNMSCSAFYEYDYYWVDDQGNKSAEPFMEIKPAYDSTMDVISRVIYLNSGLLQASDFQVSKSLNAFWVSQVSKATEKRALSTLSNIVIKYPKFLQFGTEKTTEYIVLRLNFPHVTHRAYSHIHLETVARGTNPGTMDDLAKIVSSRGIGSTFGVIQGVKENSGSIFTRVGNFFLKFGDEIAPFVKKAGPAIKTAASFGFTITFAAYDIVNINKYSVDKTWNCESFMAESISYADNASQELDPVDISNISNDCRYAKRVIAQLRMPEGYEFQAKGYSHCGIGEDKTIYSSCQLEWDSSEFSLLGDLHVAAGAVGNWLFEKSEMHWSGAPYKDGSIGWILVPRYEGLKFQVNFPDFEGLKTPPSQNFTINDTSEDIIVVGRYEPINSSFVDPRITYDVDYDGAIMEPEANAAAESIYSQTSSSDLNSDGIIDAKDFILIKAR